ncbi:MAG: WYL domain-containing protein, partial [Deltaproteobacteria bacterium]
HHAPQEVVLRFAPGSEAIGDRIFDAPDGRLTVFHVDGLLPQILSLGDRVRIESPPEAREKVRAALRRIEEKLRSPPEPPAEPLAQAPSDAPPQPQPAVEQDAKRERLRRLLLIVPAARRRPGIQLSALARELGRDAEKLREDIELLGRATG